MNSTAKIIILIVAIVICLFDLFILIVFKDKRPKKSNLHVFVGEGFFVIGKVLQRRKSGKRQIKLKRYNALCEMYDEKYANLVAENASFAPLSYIFCGIPMVLAAFLVTEEKLIPLALLVIMGFLCVYFDIWLNGAINRRHNDVLSDYATVLTKISLLINAGITAYDAFGRVSFSGEGLLYVEMRRVAKNVENGMSYEEALSQMVKRCGVKEIRKFVALYKQNLTKGGPEFPYLLSELANLAWEDRKNRAKVAGSNASQKLLIPIMLMFTGVLLMIIVPAFTSLL